MTHTPPNPRALGAGDGPIPVRTGRAESGGCRRGEFRASCARLSRVGSLALAVLVAASFTFAVAATAPLTTAGPGRATIVFCAPGYPGDTVQAQPTMDGFAALVERAAGWPAGRLGAVYYETEKGGLARLGAPDAAVALVPLPFFLEHAAGLRLTPRLEVEQASGASEVWSLVAKKGAIRRPADLDGWEVTGMPGYSVAFVRGPILGGWGSPPASVRITFSAAVLSPLRRASSGEKLAVLLDTEGVKAMGSLPFAKDLEVVVKSRPLPASLVCLVGDRLPHPDAEALVGTLAHLHERADAAETLRTMRMKRFTQLDAKALDAARKAFKEAPGAGK